MVEHKEYKRILAGAETAVLFVHGIIGTPRHFDEFVKLVPDNMSVWNILLDGHGGSVLDFANTSMKKWEQQLSSAVDELAQTHDRIFVAAHSMGTLLAIEQAMKCEKITKLFLLAVPTRIAPKPKILYYSSLIYFDRVQEDDPLAMAAKSSYSIGQDKNPFHYVGWIPRYLELFSKARRTRKLAKSLKTPCQIYQSKKDELVCVKGVDYFSGNPCVVVTMLPNSRHYFYDKNEFEGLVKSFENFTK